MNQYTKIPNKYIKRNGNLEILTNGGSFLIDDESKQEVIQFHWYTTEHGYISSQFKGKHFYLHRYLMNPNKGEYVDHINGNKLDNRLSNLRITTNRDNTANRQILNKNNTSGITGVSFSNKRKRWISQMMYNRKTINLGRYKNKKDAIIVSKYARLVSKSVVYTKNEIDKINMNTDNDLKEYVVKRLLKYNVPIYEV